jgi:hypothetical protein
MPSCVARAGPHVARNRGAQCCPRTSAKNDVPQTPTSPGWQLGASPSLGCTVGSVGNVVDKADQPVNELALRRLRRAIAPEDEDEEEQLIGVLRMLGAEIPDKNQLPLFGKTPVGKARQSDPLPGAYRR